MMNFTKPFTIYLAMKHELSLLYNNQTCSQNIIFWGRGELAGTDYGAVG